MSEKEKETAKQRQETLGLKMLEQFHLVVTIIILCLRNIHAQCREPGAGVTILEMSDECFYIHKKELTWDKAKEVCEGDGMLLAEPQDVLSLTQYFNDHNIIHHFWLGGQGNNEAMVWSSSGAEVYPEPNFPPVWETDHPEDIKRTFCLDLRPSAHPGPLASWLCNDGHRFICESGQAEPTLVSCARPRGRCIRQKGNCISRSQACHGRIFMGKKFCFDYPSCRCCAPIVCSATTLSPCRALGGTCVAADQKCEGVEITNRYFCKAFSNHPCKCCTSINTNKPCGCEYKGNFYRETHVLKGGCQDFICLKDTWMPVENSSSTCRNAECYVRDDPHITTFDHATYDNHNACNYSLVQPCTEKFTPDYDPSFGVFANLWNKFNISGHDSVVFRDSPNTVITMNYNDDAADLYINGELWEIEEPLLPFGAAQLVRDQGGEAHPVLAWLSDMHCISLLGSQGLMLEFCRTGIWSGLHIFAPDSYKNKLCGLCGYFDGIQTNDLISRDGVGFAWSGVSFAWPAGVMPPNTPPQYYVNSWKTDDQTSPSCSQTRKIKLPEEKIETSPCRADVTQLSEYRQLCNHTLPEGLTQDSQLDIIGTCTFDLCILGQSGSVEPSVSDWLAVVRLEAKHRKLIEQREGGPMCSAPDPRCIGYYGLQAFNGSCQLICSSDEVIGGHCPGVGCICCINPDHSS